MRLYDKLSAEQEANTGVQKLYRAGVGRIVHRLLAGRPFKLASLI